MKSATKRVAASRRSRPAAHLQGSGPLHDGDARGHGHGLFLVVRDHHAGHADLLDDVDQLELGLLRAASCPAHPAARPAAAAGLLGQVARQRHPLLLTARKLVRLAFANLPSWVSFEHLDALADLGPSAMPRAPGRRRCCSTPSGAGTARTLWNIMFIGRSVGRHAARSCRAGCGPEVGVSKPASMRSSVLFAAARTSPAAAKISPLAMSTTRG